MTNQSLQEKFTASIIHELEFRSEELDHSVPLRSIYFGGGTPSLLHIKYLNQIFEKIYSIYSVDSNAEITLEANPDDLKYEQIQSLRTLPVNRLSIGIQSFYDTHLRWMNRAHRSEEVLQCLEDTYALGFNSISVDLIYGFDTLSDEEWEKNLNQILLFDHIKHLSCYQLTVEPKTPLDKKIRQGIYKLSDDEKFVRQFDILNHWLEQSGFAAYEISNSSKKGYEAVHNSNYWKGYPYLGLGPSAHSFDGQYIRKKNTAHLSNYIINPLQFEIENLTTDERYNEYVMTRLRTIWGIDINEIEDKFGPLYKEHLMREIQNEDVSPFIIQTSNIIQLNTAGRLLADGIAATLFI